MRHAELQMGFPIRSETYRKYCKCHPLGDLRAIIPKIPFESPRRHGGMVEPAPVIPSPRGPKAVANGFEHGVGGDWVLDGIVKFSVSLEVGVEYVGDKLGKGAVEFGNSRPTALSTCMSGGVKNVSAR